MMVEETGSGFRKLQRDSLLEQALPAGGPPVRLVKAARICFEPGQPTGLHRHPVSTCGVVTVGQFIIQLEGERERLIGVGDAFSEPAVRRSSSSTMCRRTSPVRSSAAI
jgi:quercetin dioxygenase-like cupin family protein